MINKNTIAMKLTSYGCAGSDGQDVMEYGDEILCTCKVEVNVHELTCCGSVGSDGQGVMEYVHVKRCMCVVYIEVNVHVHENRVHTGCCCAVSEGQGVMEYERDTYVQVKQSTYRLWLCRQC